MSGSIDARIVARRLSKDFGDFTAVDEIDFEVRPGEIFGFLGPNGSGKTTTIRMMLGLLPPTKGSVRVLDVPVHENPAGIRQHVGYMAQQFSIYGDLSVAQNLTFYGQAYGLSNRELAQRIDEALALSGLRGRERARTSELSGGWRQRLALSAAILHEPQVLFLDEPTAGVDPVSRREFWELLYRLVEEGVTVFVTTHYMDEAEHCHRLGFIQRGQLIASGTPGEIKRNEMKGRVVELLVDETRAAIDEFQRASQSGQIKLDNVELHGAAVHAVVRDGSVAVEGLRDLLEARGITVRRMREIEPSLEDVFIACMR